MQFRHVLDNRIHFRLFFHFRPALVCTTERASNSEARRSLSAAMPTLTDWSRLQVLINLINLMNYLLRRYHFLFPRHSDILAVFNPSLEGMSHGIGSTHSLPNCQFNMAEIGAETDGMPEQVVFHLNKNLISFSLKMPFQTCPVIFRIFYV